jgi:homoisocitrate dehydrogenase
MEALGSALPKITFVPLLAGWEEFNKRGKALPEETIRYGRPGVFQRQS